MSSQLKISEVACRILVNRGITSRELLKDYLNPKLVNMHNPAKMMGLERAVKIILDGISSGKRFRIVGDYDVDGVISCFILISALNRLKAKVDFEIPDRIKDGYGINERIVREAKEDGVDVLITCDNGIAAYKAVECAKSLGMTVIITDHHEIPYAIEGDKREYNLPRADAVVNPKQKNCPYPFKELCGAGVVLKVIQNLYRQKSIPDSEAMYFVQYVAIATVCDIVNLYGENRIIVKNGLNALANTDNIGIRELFKVNDVLNRPINTYTLGFIIGPCINAAGRLDSGSKAVELLLANDVEKARSLALELYRLNQERRELTQIGYEKAVACIENTHVKEDKVKVVFDDEIHESVAGIVAGRIKDKYHVPAIVLTKSMGTVKGSARSIEAYNIFEALSSCRSILSKFGGHSMAAGLSLDEDNIDVLRQRLNGQCELRDEDLIPKLIIDVLLPISEVTFKLLEELEFLEPYGKGNEKPIFGDKSVGIIKAQVLGKDKNVLSLKLVSYPDGKIVDGIYFGDIDYFNKYIESRFGSENLNKMYSGVQNEVLIDIAYYPKLNEYNGNRRKQVNILHIR